MKKKEEHRGGARKGSGRKPKNVGEKVITISFCCSPEQQKKLNAECERLKIKRSAYICERLFS